MEFEYNIKIESVININFYFNLFYRLIMENKQLKELKTDLEEKLLVLVTNVQRRVVATS